MDQCLPSHTQIKVESKEFKAIDWRSRSLPAASITVDNYLLQTCAYLLLNFLFTANLLK